MIDFATMIARGRLRDRPQLSLDDCEILDHTAREIHPQHIVEIGGGNGTSTQVLGGVAQACGGWLTTIEPRPGPHWQQNVAAAGLAKVVTLVKARSPWVPLLLAHPRLDYLFIDGEHKSRWALVDYHCFEPFVRVGGRIAFHDIYGPPSRCVWRAIELILEDDARKLIEIARGAPARDAGTIVFEKRNL